MGNRNSLCSNLALILIAKLVKFRNQKRCVKTRDVCRRSLSIPTICVTGGGGRRNIAMDCSQILPGAVNSAPCSLATGYYNEHPFIVSHFITMSLAYTPTASSYPNQPSISSTHSYFNTFSHARTCIYVSAQVYASGRDIVILDGRLKHVQTLLGSDLGYGETPINCVHCAELVGKIAVAWGSDVVIFLPEPLDDNQGQNNNEVYMTESNC